MTLFMDCLEADSRRAKGIKVKLKSTTEKMDKITRYGVKKSFEKFNTHTYTITWQQQQQQKRTRVSFSV